MEDEFWPRSLESFWRNYATALRYSERVGPLRKELTEWWEPQTRTRCCRTSAAMSGLLESLGPVVGLARVASGEMSREAYLEQWGHRGPLRPKRQPLGPRRTRIGSTSSWRPLPSRRWMWNEMLEQAARRIRCCLGAFPGTLPRKDKPMRRRLEQGCRGRPDARSGPLRERADHLGGSHLGPCAPAI